MKIITPLVACCAIILVAAGCNNTEKNLTEKSTVLQNEQLQTQTQIKTKSILVKDKTLVVEVQDTPATRERGLSGHAPLSDEQGMLFDFTNTTTTQPGFWMKDMLFNIDIVWINNGTIIGISKNTPKQIANEQLPIYYPPSDITHVLEVNANWTDRYNISVGDKIRL